MSIKYSDSGFLDGADETKKLSFDVSGVTTGTTRTITMPDANVDLSSVGTPDDNSVTLAKMAGGTDGNLITYDASGDPAYVTTGTSGQVLTSGGTGVAPTFQTAAGGGKVLQVVNVNPSKTSTVTKSGSIGELTTDLRLAITPLSATSKLYFSIDMPFVSPNSTALHYGYFYNVTSTSIVNQPAAVGSRKRVHWHIRVRGYDSNDFSMMNFRTVEASSSTTARTYTIYYGNEGVSAAFFVMPLSTASGTVTKPLFTITEVEV